MTYLSGKITNSFFSFLNLYEFDTSRLFDMTSLDMDRLRDPYSLMQADQVEQFLSSMQKHYNTHFMDKDFITSVGHHCIHLKCWGELGTLLKLFKTPNELHRKLSILFSYFMNPVFDMREEKESEQSFCFYTDFDIAELPLTHLYFKAILESLPLFTGGELTEVKWSGKKVEIFYPHEKNLSLSIEEFKTQDTNTDYLLNKIYNCEKNIAAFKKQKKIRLLNKVLVDLNDLKQEYKKNGLKK